MKLLSVNVPLGVIIGVFAVIVLFHLVLAVLYLLGLDHV